MVFKAKPQAGDSLGLFAGQTRPARGNKCLAENKNGQPIWLAGCDGNLVLGLTALAQDAEGADTKWEQQQGTGNNGGRFGNGTVSASGRAINKV